MERIFLFCFKSCLKGEGDHEYYEVLEIDSGASLEVIKRQYKKMSLSLHPDKLAQKGLEVTAEHKQRFLKVKEAYDVLSDPKRRRLYDQLGASGLKLVESPTEVNHSQLLKNFQKNHKDRTSVILLIALVFASILILPILFSLKCDGTLGDNAPWTAIWTPMWLVDLFLLVAAIHFMFDKPEPPAPTEEGDTAPPPEEEVPFSVKISNLISTALFILIQILILMRMDKDIHWSWFKVFVPWFVYEGVHVASQLKLAFLTTIAPPDFENLTLIVEEGHGGEEEIFMQKIQLENKYFEALLEQKNAQRSVLVSLLRAWQAVFLALKLNGNNWNWGLVLLPVWVYLFSQYVFSYLFRLWGLSKLSGLDVEGIMAGTETDPLAMAKLQQGNELLSSSFFSCLFQALPLFMALMLVCRLQVSGYSTFLIILPVFLTIGCCCCVVFCGICCLSVVDTDELDGEAEKQRQQQEGAAHGEQNGEKEYTPPQPHDVTAGNNNVSHTANPTAEYGTFPVVVPSPSESQSPIQQSAAPQPSAVELKAVTTIDADID